MLTTRLLTLTGLLLFFAIYPATAECSDEDQWFEHESAEYFEMRSYLYSIKRNDEGDIFLLYNFSGDAGQFELADFQITTENRGFSEHIPVLVKFDKNFNYQWHIDFIDQEYITEGEDIFINSDGSIDLLLKFNEPEGDITVGEHAIEANASDGYITLDISPEGNITDGNLFIEGNASISTTSNTANERFIYLWFNDTITFGDTTMKPNEEWETSRMIVNITDPAEPEYIAVNEFYFKGGSLLRDFHATEDGDIILSMSYAGPSYFFGDTLPHYANFSFVRNFFAGKISSDGEKLWSYYPDVSTGMEGGKVLTDDESNVYLTGEAQEDVDFGNGVAFEENTDGWDGFLLKMDSEGTPQNVNHLASDNTTEYRHITWMPGGRQEILAVGNFNGNTTIDGQDYYYDPQDENDNHQNPFLATMDTDLQYNNVFVGESDSNFRFFDAEPYDEKILLYGANNQPVSIFNLEVPGVTPVRGSTTPFLAQVCMNHLTTGLSASQQAIKNNISVYPNPAREQLTITPISKGTEITIKDLKGRTIHSQTIKNNQEKTTIDIGNIQTGSYLIHITGKKGEVHREMFIKE